MGMRDDDIVKEATPSAQDRVERMKKELNQKRIPSDPDRDTSGDSVYKPEPREIEPGEVWTGSVDMRDPVGPDSPVTINGYQAVQVMPLSQFNPEKDLLIINVSVGKLRPDRAKQMIQHMKDEMTPWIKDLGWKHVMYVPVSFDHPMHRQFRTVNVIDCHGMSDKDKQAVLDKMREELGPIGGPDANHISGEEYLDGDTATSSLDDPPPPWDDD